MAGPKQAWVLVVSDDPSLADEIRSSLPPEIDTEGVRDARRAWTAMTGRRPQAVIVDLQTGSAGGFALAKDMAQLARLAAVPVVMLLERAQDGWLARQAGATAYFARPVAPQVVAESVLSHLG